MCERQIPVSHPLRQSINTGLKKFGEKCSFSQICEESTDLLEGKKRCLKEREREKILREKN